MTRRADTEPLLHYACHWGDFDHRWRRGWAIELPAPLAGGQAVVEATRCTLAPQGFGGLVALIERTQVGALIALIVLRALRALRASAGRDGSRPYARTMLRRHNRRSGTMYRARAASAARSLLGSAGAVATAAAKCVVRSAGRHAGLPLRRGGWWWGVEGGEPLIPLAGAGIVHLSNDAGVGQLVTQLRDRLPWLGSRCACSSPSDSRRTIAASAAAGTARSSATWLWASSQACCALAAEGDVSGSISYTEWHYGTRATQAEQARACLPG